MFIRRRAGWPARQWFMSTTATNPHLCFAEGDGEGEGNGGGDNGGSGGDELSNMSPEELISMVKSLQSNKKRSDASSINNKTRADALETELNALKEAEAARLMKEAEDNLEFEKLRDEEKARADAAEGKLSDLTKRMAIGSELSKLKIAPEAMDDLQANFASRAKVDGDKVTIDGEGLEDFFKGWAETDRGKFYILDTDQGGGANGGSNGGGSGKTMKRSDFDRLDAQGRHAAMKSGVTLTD